MVRDSIGARLDDGHLVLDVRPRLRLRPQDHLDAERHEHDRDEKPEHEITAQSVARPARLPPGPASTAAAHPPAGDRRDEIGAEGHLRPLAVVVADGQGDRARREDRRQQIEEGILVEERECDKTVTPAKQAARERGHLAERIGPAARQGEPRPAGQADPGGPGPSQRLGCGV